MERQFTVLVLKHFLQVLFAKLKHPVDGCRGSAKMYYYLV